MINETIFNLTASNYNVGDFSLSNIPTVCSGIEIPFSSILSVCQQWMNQSTYAHNTYIWMIGLYYLIKLVQKFYNPSMTYSYNNDDLGFIKKYFNKNYKPEIKQDFFYWGTEIRDVLRGLIFIKIIQVWYVVNFIA